MADNKELFDELRNSLNERESEQATVYVENNTPRDAQIYLSGVCEFVFADGSKSLDRQLHRHFAGDTVQFQSNQPDKCCSRVNVALIAKSLVHPGEAGIPLAADAGEGKCWIRRGWTIGPNEKMSAMTEKLDLSELLEVSDR